MRMNFSESSRILLYKYAKKTSFYLNHFKKTRKRKYITAKNLKRCPTRIKKTPKQVESAHKNGVASPVLVIMET